MNATRARVRALGVLAAVVAVLGLTVVPAGAATTATYSSTVISSAEATGLPLPTMAAMLRYGWSVPRVEKSGGPACTYDPYHIIETCFQHGGHGTIVSVWGSLTSQFNKTKAVSLFGWTKNNTLRHAAGACAGGAIGGAIAGAVAGGLTITAGVAGGCIGGALSYWWAK